MKRVIAYSYFRNPHSSYEKEKGNSARQFEIFLPLIVRAHHMIWPDWEMWLYRDDESKRLSYTDKLERLAANGYLKLIDFGPSRTLCGIGGMLERMRPVWEEDVDWLLCRDVDSIPSPRERMAVEEFMQSGKTVHAIHDAPKPHAGAHAGLMGGTLGVHVPRFRELLKFPTLEAWIAHGEQVGIDFNRQGADQALLNTFYSIFAPYVLLHGLHRTSEPEMPGCEVRRQIARRPLPDVRPVVMQMGDSFCRIIGGCDWPDKALEFYRHVDDPIIARINGIEGC